MALAAAGSTVTVAGRTQATFDETVATIGAAGCATVGDSMPLTKLGHVENDGFWRRPRSAQQYSPKMWIRTWDRRPVLVGLVTDAKTAREIRSDCEYGECGPSEESDERADEQDDRFWQSGVEGYHRFEDDHGGEHEVDARSEVVEHRRCTL